MNLARHFWINCVKGIMALTAGLVVGFLAYPTLMSFGVLFPSDRVLARAHSRRLERYLEYVKSPGNLKTNARGLAYIDEPFDIGPSLASLVSSGDLDYVDLVLPNTPYWDGASYIIDTFVRSHSNVVYVQGNGEYPMVPIVGHQPIHVQIWFRRGSEAEVRELVAEIERASLRSGEDAGEPCD